MNIKKRFVSMILCCVILLSAFSLTDINEIIPAIKASATQADEVPVYYGDMNENGKIEASDARIILQKAASLKTLTDRQMQLADCNQDGKITAVDARTTLRIAAQLEDAVIYANGETNSVDYLTLYAEQIRKDGKTVTHNNVKYKFIGAAVCKMIANSIYPQLAVAYHSTQDAPMSSNADIFALKIFDYKDGKVSLVAQYYTDAFSNKDLSIWKDPVTKLYTFIIAESFSENWSLYRYDILSENKKEEIISQNCWNPTTRYYGNYKNTFDSPQDYNNYIAFHFGEYYYTYNVLDPNTFETLFGHSINSDYTYVNNIKINVIKDNGKYETKTFSF